MKIWQPATTTKDFALSDGVLPFRLESFGVYVNQEDSFLFTSEKINTEWANTQGLTVIRTAKVDKDDPYFCSLLTAYVLSQKGGVCIEHLEGKGVPKVTRTIMRFYLYYHLRRFLRNPSKLEKNVTKEDLEVIQANLPVRKVWVKKQAQGVKSTLSAWLAGQANKNNIRNVRLYGGGVGGATGIEYEEVSQVLPVDQDNDWKKFIQAESDGVTKTGQLFYRKPQRHTSTVCSVHRHRRGGRS